MARSRLSRLSLLTCQSTPIRALHSTRIQTANPIDGTPVRPPTLHHADLSTTISAIFNTPYLSRAPMQVIRPLRIEGILHGPMLNPIVSMVASHGLNAIHVHFLVDPSSPTTFLSRQVDPVPNIPNYPTNNLTSSRQQPLSSANTSRPPGLNSPKSN